jgi:hypothetical protein
MMDGDHLDWLSKPLHDRAPDFSTDEGRKRLIHFTILANGAGANPFTTSRIRAWNVNVRFGALRNWRGLPRGDKMVTG